MTKYIPPVSNIVKSDLERFNLSDYKTFGVRGTDVNTFPQELTGKLRSCSTNNCLAYTFDDGPRDHMRKIVDEAVEHGIKVTFFVNAQTKPCIYDEQTVANLRYAYSKGMEIGSHTATHPHLNDLTHDQIDKQIEALDNVLWKILGVVPNSIRLPYGEGSLDVVQYINQRHKKVVIDWDVDTEDSMGASLEQSKEIVDMVKLPEDAIVLMHENIRTSPTELFPYAIKTAVKHGYKMKDIRTISEALNFNPYAIKASQGKRDSTWSCAGLTSLSEPSKSIAP
ncbi:MAG: Carbohydrate esterase 4 protein [Bathelium mastoideum]|nr:MAG: Carbohydrate esterase 4 protein [Bathelium mastoideum]